MAEAGYTFAKTGPAPSDRIGLTKEAQRAIGYDKSADREWEDVVDEQPGETWGARLRSALQLTLEPYDYDKDKAIKELRDAGPTGLVRYTGEGKPIGGKALAGALRAAARHPNMHRMWTQAEMAEENARTGGARRTRRVLSPTERAERDVQTARRKAARETLERSGGGTDLRRRPTAGKGRRADIVARGKARRESFRRAAREAAIARANASKVAVKAGRMSLQCTGLGPFGFPPATEAQPHAAEFYVWPVCEPQITWYATLCAAHLGELQARRLVFQTTNIQTGAVAFPAREGATPHG